MTRLVMLFFILLPIMLISTAYFPPILYYSWLLQNHELKVEQFETYPKQSYRNRCNILTANGLQALIVPVIKNSGIKTLSKDIKISYETPWQQLHWRSLKTAYSGSPFFLYYQDELKEFYKSKAVFLMDMNETIINLINAMMEWEVKIERTAYFEFPNKVSVLEDKRYSLSPKDSQKLGLESYIQVFSDQFPFIENLSILDLIFNLGPEAESYLMKIKA